MSGEYSHSVPTGGNSCFLKYPGILTSRASTDLQIMQRDLQPLPYNLSCSARLCRKSLIFIAAARRDAHSLCGTFHTLVL